MFVGFEWSTHLASNSIGQVLATSSWSKNARQPRRTTGSHGISRGPSGRRLVVSMMNQNSASAAVLQVVFVPLGIGVMEDRELKRLAPNSEELVSVMSFGKARQVLMLITQ